MQNRWPRKLWMDWWMIFILIVQMKKVIENDEEVTSLFMEP
jgi:hypothetical protein